MNLLSCPMCPMCQSENYSDSKSLNANIYCITASLFISDLDLTKRIHLRSEQNSTNNSTMDLSVELVALLKHAGVDGKQINLGFTG